MKRASGRGSSVVAAVLFGVAACGSDEAVLETRAAALDEFDDLVTETEIPGDGASPWQNGLPGAADDEAAFKARADFLVREAADYYQAPGWPSSRWRVTSADPLTIARDPTGFDPLSTCCSDAQKYYLPMAIARLWRYPGDAEGNHWISRFAELQGSSPARYPFHFAFPVIARLLRQWPAEPAVVASELAYLKQVWNRNDYYNAFTGEGTENHVVMSRPSAYLLLERMEAYPPAEFPPRQIDGEALGPTAMKAKMRAWIETTARRMYETGPGEWDSNTYVMFAVQGWINLYDFAADPAVKAWARAVLDFYAAGLALKYTHGVLGGASMRGGELVSTTTESGFLAWLWFGDSPRPTFDAFATPRVPSGFTFTRAFPGNQFVSAVLAAVSHYRPPALALALARKSVDVPSTYRNSKAAMLMEGRLIKEVFHVGPGYTLGSTMSPYGGFTGGDNQTLNWKLTARASTGASALTVTGNGGTRAGNNGQGRNPWDQLVQHGNVLMQLTRVPVDAAALTQAAFGLIDVASPTGDELADDDWRARWDRDMQRRFGFDLRPPGSVGAWERPDNLVTKAPIVPTASYGYVSFPSGVERVAREGVLFLDLQGSFAALRTLNGGVPSEEAAGTGRRQVRDVAPLGSLCGFVLEVGSAVEHGSFVAFQDAILARTRLDLAQLAAGQVVYTALSGDVVDARFVSAGSFTAPIYQWGWGPTTPQFVLRAPPFLQPTWPSGEGHGRMAAWSVNGVPVDLALDWPVWGGTNLHLAGRKLKMHVGPIRYDVDFSGEVPTFVERRF